MTRPIELLYIAKRKRDQRRARLARLTYFCIVIFLTAAMFYAATN